MSAGAKGLLGIITGQWIWSAPVISIGDHDFSYTVYSPSRSGLVVKGSRYSLSVESPELDPTVLSPERIYDPY